MGARSLRPGLRALAALLLISSAWGRRLGEGEASNAAPLNAALTAALSAAADASNAACTLTDAACGGPAWAQASSAVALLLLSNPTSARFCTGALLSTPHLDGNFVLTANHCRGTDSAASLASRAAVVFGRRRPTCPGGSSAAPSPRRLQEQGQPPPLVLRGLSVAWADEATDVLLLRLTTAQIPPEWGVGRLGWNASSWAPAATRTATISHPRGDWAKLSLSGAGGLRLARSSALPAPAADGVDGAGDGAAAAAATHYRLTWGPGGGTDVGSSGAPLLDTGGRAVLGVLTGGSPSPCIGRDYFGSLRAAWLRGLWTVLSPQGPAAVTSMPSAAALTAPASGSSAQRPRLAAPLAAQGGSASRAMPQQPVVIEGAEQLDFSWAGTLPGPAAHATPLHLGTALDVAAAALLPGTAHHFQLGSALTLNATLQACSQQAPLQVAVFSGAGSTASWLSTDPCTNAAGSGACTAASADADGCSSLSGLVLPGQGNGPPVTIAVLPLAPALAAPAAEVPFRLRLTAAPVPPLFTALP